VVAFLSDRPVDGDADDRVSYLEDVLLERGLRRLDVPHELLVFPGENPPLDKDPWHGYIKVREEMKWLEKYVPKE
jgi:dipeptidyl aminopeptidase/acylaminoacyl peptidase